MQDDDEGFSSEEVEAYYEAVFKKVNEIAEKYGIENPRPDFIIQNEHLLEHLMPEECQIVNDNFAVHKTCVNGQIKLFELWRYRFLLYYALPLLLFSMLVVVGTFINELIKGSAHDIYLILLPISILVIALIFSVRKMKVLAMLRPIQAKLDQVYEQLKLEAEKKDEEKQAAFYQEHGISQANNSTREEFSSLVQYFTKNEVQEVNDHFDLIKTIRNYSDRCRMSVYEHKDLLRCLGFMLLSLVVVAWLGWLYSFGHVNGVATVVFVAIACIALGIAIYQIVKLLKILKLKRLQERLNKMFLKFPVSPNQETQEGFECLKSRMGK